MSFGFGVGDFLAVSKLALKVHGRLRDSPDQYKAIQNEVGSFYAVLDSIARKQSPELLLNEQQEQNLSAQKQICEDLLEELEEHLESYKDLEQQPSGFRSTVRKHKGKLRWSQEEINQFRQRLISNIGMLNAINISLTSQAANTTHELLVRMKDQIEAIGDRLQTNNSNGKNQVVLDWICTMTFTKQLNSFLEKRQEGTGQWFLESTAFQTWITSNGMALVCQGMPGAGKTILASQVINHIQHHFTETPSTTAYIYCDYRRQQDQIANILVGSLLRQVAQQQKTMPEEIIESYQKHLETKSSMTKPEMIGFLHLLARRAPRLYLIVDAPDELTSDVRQELLEDLSTLQSNHDVNVMVTSRHIPDLLPAFDHSLSLDIRASDEDVRTSAEAYIAKLAKQKRFIQKDTGLQLSIVDAVVRTAGGMFLLARLNLDSLARTTNLRSLEKTLKSLPIGSQPLDQAYHEAIKRIDDQQDGPRDLAFEALGWLTHAKSIMTITELLHALAIEVGDEEFDEDRLSDSETLLSACAGLIIIDEKTGIVRLVHYTTQDFLMRHDRRFLPDARHKIAMKCLTYLLYDIFQEGWIANDSLGKGSDRVSERLVIYPFLKYAAKYWTYHSDDYDNMSAAKLLMAFLKNDHKVSNAMQVAIYLDQSTDRMVFHVDSSAQSDTVSGIHALAYHGCEAILSRLLSIEWDVNTRDKGGRSPLWWAIYSQQVGTVKLLLSQDHVDVNTLGHCDWSMSFVSMAIEVIYEAPEIFDLLLLKEDLDLEIQDHRGMTPFASACYYGYLNAAKRLYRRGATFKTTDNSDTTPFMWAVEGRSWTVVEFLAGLPSIQISAEDDKHNSVLLYAMGDWSYWSKDRPHRVAIIRRLLQRSDIDINKRNKRGHTVLTLAVTEAACEELVRLLLSDSRLDLNTVDGEGRGLLSQLRDLVNLYQMQIRPLFADADAENNFPFHRHYSLGQETVECLEQAMALRVLTEMESLMELVRQEVEKRRIPGSWLRRLILGFH